LIQAARRAAAEQTRRAFAALCRAAGLPEPEPEFKFHETRRWRMDYAWPEQRVYLEVDGGVWIGGRHTSGAGWVKDAEKHNAAAVLGWRRLQCQPAELLEGPTIALVRDALAVEG
jgi:hypothetical protein